MSSLPGTFLEDFIEWNYNLVVIDNRPDVNPSLQIAEALGLINVKRPRVTTQDFNKIVKLFEAYREPVEDALLDFDEETQGWRSYSNVVSSHVPDEVYEQASTLLKSFIHKQND